MYASLVKEVVESSEKELQALISGGKVVARAEAQLAEFKTSLQSNKKGLREVSKG